MIILLGLSFIEGVFMNITTKAFLVTALYASVWSSQSTFAASPNTPAESEWVVIAQNSDDTTFYSGKSGSFEITTTKAGTRIAMILGQIEDKKLKTVTYNKWYVTTADCDAGIGKLVVLKVNGDFDNETDYVSKGKNIASGIGDMICDIYQSDKKEKNGKSV